MKILAVIFAISLGACQFGYTQGGDLPAGFPEYIDTGNPERDMADLAARKQAWAEANPIAHKAYILESSSLLAEKKTAHQLGITAYLPPNQNQHILIQHIDKEREITNKSSLWGNRKEADLVGKPAPRREHYKEVSAFETAMQDWKMANLPTVNHEPSQGKCVLTRKIYDNLTKEKRMYVDAHLDAYEIIEED